MLAPKQLGRQNKPFFLALGLVSGALNGGVFWWLFQQIVFEYEPFVAYLPVVLGLGAFATFYRFELLLSARSAGWMLGHGAIRWLRVLLLAIVLLFFLMHDYFFMHEMRQLLLQWISITAPAQLLLLYASRKLALFVNTSAKNRRPAIFIGMGNSSQVLAQRLMRSPILGFEVLGYYAKQPADFSAAGAAAITPRYRGDYAQSIRDIDAGKVAVVFISYDESENSAEFQIVADAILDSPIAIYYVPEIGHPAGLVVQGVDVAGVPLLALHETTLLGAALYAKRIIDLVISGLAVIALSPLLAFVALAIRLDSKGPIIYRQKRYGVQGKKIEVYKFRSMVSDAEQEGFLRQATKDDERITRVGRFLRRSSIDELPQLFNVLQGSMSLVGPRPHAVSHNEYYRQQIRGYMLRHTVKPGITGWAQVHGLRGETETVEQMQRRVQYDRFYIAHWSLSLDFKIMLMTFVRLFHDKKAY